MWGQHPIQRRSPWRGPLTRCGQVGQYISRAEELKALVTSSSKNLLQRENPARELLKGTGGLGLWEQERGTQWGLGLKGAPPCRDGQGQAPALRCAGDGFCCHR